MSAAAAPWSVKGIDPKAREIAKDLARRSGMTLGEWLNSMIMEDGEERRDLRAVTETHVSDDGTVTVRVAQELDWYRWGWNGKIPRTLEVPAHLVWVE